MVATLGRVPYVDDESRAAAHDRLHELAEWSGWRPFAEAIAEAPRLPGVYLFREPESGLVRYAGMAGERAGSGYPTGLSGRLRVYLTGQGPVSGFGEAALDRALADPEWVAHRLGRLRTEGPERAKAWAAAAVARIAPDVSWATCADRVEARWLEERVVDLLKPHGLWNR